MRRRFVFGFILSTFSIFVILFPNHLKGQGYKTFKAERRQIEEEVKFEIGPFKIFPSILVSNVGYDSNLYNMPERADPISDYTATFSFQIRAYLLYRDWITLSFTEIPEYVFYLEEKNQQGWNNSFSTEVKFLIFHRFVLSGNYLNRFRRYRVTSEFDVPTYEKVRNYGGRFFIETARGTSFGITTSIREISYEDISQPGDEIPISVSLNRQEFNLSFDFYYRIREETNFFISSGYSEYDFDYIEAQWQNSRSYQIYAGFQFPLLGRITGSVSLGYKKLIPESEGVNGYSGLVGNTNFNVRSGRFVFRLLYTRDIPFSYYTDNIYFIEKTYGLGTSYYLTQFFRIDYNLSYRLSDYPEESFYSGQDGSDEMIKRKYKSMFHTVGFVIQIMKKTGIGLNVNFWNRNSSIPNGDLERAFFGFYITYDF